MQADNLNVAKRTDKVKMSTCSEVVMADIEEDIFETPFDLADLEVSHQKINSITEQSAMPALVVSAVESPKVHTLQKVAVKVSRVLIKMQSFLAYFHFVRFCKALLSFRLDSNISRKI